MAFAAGCLYVAEDKSAEFTSSDISLPHINKNKRASASFPAIRPNLSSTVPQNVVKIFKRLGKVCYQQFTIPATESIQPKDSFSLDETKNIIIDLAAELDRVLQSNILCSMTRKFKNKGTKEEQEEQQHYILQWAEDLENTQTKLDKEEKQQTGSKQLSNSEMKFNKAKKILSDWSWKLKEMKQVCTCILLFTEIRGIRHVPGKPDVKKKCEWRVGVVKESAPRNGYVTMNTKTGYWNLRLQLGTLMALTEPVTKLNLPKPSKIGVYLDIDEGHVSFYDAVKRKHIYTFNTDFNETENIYPMFGTVETDRALVISS